MKKFEHSVLSTPKIISLDVVGSGTGTCRLSGVRLSRAWHVPAVHHRQLQVFLPRIAKFTCQIPSGTIVSPNSKPGTATFTNYDKLGGASPWNWTWRLDVACQLCKWSYSVRVVGYSAIMCGMFSGMMCNFLILKCTICNSQLWNAPQNFVRISWSWYVPWNDKWIA